MGRTDEKNMKKGGRSRYCGGEKENISMSTS
jgi:hypothetical protein